MEAERYRGMDRERNVEEELHLERLRDLRSRRKAREQSEIFSLVERAAILLVTVAGSFSTLIHYPRTPSITAVGCALGGGLALIYRQRR
jgi:hypothetical protein